MNLINNQGVMSDFTQKTESNYCQPYGVNCFEEQIENRYVTKLNIRVVAVDC